MKNVNENEKFDVVIIGAGITGCMTAYMLAGYDLRVAVLERGPDVAVGATGANSAIVHAGFDPKPGTVKAALNAKGARMLLEIARKLGVKHRVNGAYVMAFNDEDERAHVKQLIEWGKLNGVEKLEFLEGDEVRAREAAVSDNVTCALFAPESGIVCPYGLAIAVAEVAAVNGTGFFFGFEAKKIEKDPENGVFSVSDGNGRTVRADYIVNAAGTHAEDIAFLCGEDDFPARALPRRGEYMLLDKNCGSMINSTLFACPGKMGKGIILSPTADGNIILGPNAHDVGKDDTFTTPEGLEEIVRGASRLVKKLDTRPVITQFAGVRPNCVLGDFYLKASEKVPGLIHLAGIESPGLASSPAVALTGVGLLEDAGLKLRERKNYIPDRPPHIEFRELSDEEKDALVRRDPSYGRVICRCENITEGEILDAIRRPLGARTVDMVKRRTRAGMGRCQGGFCMPRVIGILSRELGVPMTEIRKSDGDSVFVPEELRPDPETDGGNRK